MLPAFATHGIQVGYVQASRSMPFYINDTAHASSALTTTKNGSGSGSYQYYPTATTIGNNIFETFGSSGGSSPNVQGWQFASPIHTSSHYQTFATPYLHELVGGDRNMEQTNLVVTPDGKTWDEVTRDTSYIGTGSAWVTRDGGNYDATSQTYIWDWIRGLATSTNSDAYTKDFVMAYDRMLCIRDGNYTIMPQFASINSSDMLIIVYKNEIIISEYWKGSNVSEGSTGRAINSIFKRGDNLKFVVRYVNGTSRYRTYLTIVRNS